MRIFKYIIRWLFCLMLMCPFVQASEKCPDCGTVSGTVSIWKTKIKTKGPKSGKEVVVFLEDT